MKNIKYILLLIASVLLSTTVNAEHGKVRANGIEIAYESFGDRNNPAIILIQGTGATMLHYPAQLCKKLAESGLWVIRFDNRDIGLSSKIDSLGQPDWAAIFPFVKTCDPAPLPYTLLDMADDVIGLMDALKIEQAHIVGTSMGGAIAQLITIHYPKRVLTLTCLASSTGNPNRPEGDEQALKAMSTPPPETNDEKILAAYLVNVYKALGAVDEDSVLWERAMGHLNRGWYPEGTNRQVAAVLIGEYCDRRPQLSNIEVPTLIIHGDADPIVKLDCGIELSQSIPEAELLIIKGMGHDISLKFVSEIAKSIRNNTSTTL